MNTTHLGAPPEQEPVPGNWKTIPKDITVIDVITDPRITLFLKAARDKYCAIAGGVEMLVQLAMQIFEEWTGINLMRLYFSRPLPRFSANSRYISLHA